MNNKAISLFSGGLDSILATKIIMEQGIDVTAIHFTSPFSSKKEKERGLRAVRSADELGIELILEYKGLDFLDIVRSPKYGYGKNLNPCIDCRIFMLQKTKDRMADKQANFVITGEVLGQRPMSQRRDTIHIIEKASGLEGLIVRPLSAIHFTPSRPEQEGVLDRKKLLDFTGRTRTPQYRLAEKYHLTEFDSPGGGCLLTDPIFSKKLKGILDSNETITTKDLELLSIGRHFNFPDNTRLIIGRNETENNRLISLWEKPYTLLQPVDFKGPAAILKGTFNNDTIEITANIMGHYGKYKYPIISVESKTDSGTTNIHSVKNRGTIPEVLLSGLPKDTQ